MANLSYWSGAWVGSGFNPGAEHYWWMGPIGYAQVVSLTANAVQSLDRELMVKDVRTHVDPAGNRVLLLTVRNTGANNVPGYTLNYSFVNP